MAATVNSHDFLDPPVQSGDLGVLGHYRVLNELGKGGMGFVFKAEDTKLKRPVALKVMNQKIAATPHSRRRFLHEARAMAAVHHDNVATIFEVGESKGTPFMAMEMLKGSTLEKFNESNERLGFETIIEYARQISRGLAAAHANGIVHRDIKPANIWIEQGSERVKILDFGLALASTPVDHLAGRGAVIGTPGYLSPEQARSEPLDDRSDLYSLGVVLYELCTGQLPILSKSVPGQLISILAHRPTPINEVNPEIPQPLCDLVHKLLRKEPRSRPSSAATLAEDLDRVETECHAKSEVAQAISKLQMGLSEVVSKKESESLFETLEEIEEPILDPLAAIPAAVTMVPPAKPVAKPTARSSSAATRTGRKTHWPIVAGGGAVVLIVAAVLIIAMSRSGDNQVAQVTVDKTPPTNGSAITMPAGTRQTPPADNDAQDSAASKQPSGQPDRQPPSAESGSKKKPSGGQRNRKNQRNKNAGQGQQPDGNSQPPKDSQPAESQPAPKSRPDAKTLAASPVSTTMPDRDSGPPPKAAVTPAPAAVQEPPVELVTTIISAADGKGADALVDKTKKESLGDKPAIGVQMRRGVETMHSYIRFDLSEIADVISYVEEAELILTVVGSRRPVGATLRVVGIDVEVMWPEYGIRGIQWYGSFSEAGLGSLPVLAETKVTAARDPRDRNANVVRLASPKLAQFIAASPRNRVTLALAGSGVGKDALLFVSREKSSDQAPKLVVKAPKEPPADDKKKSNK